MIALGATLVVSVNFATNLFAQSGDITSCASKLTAFVKELDDLLARNPNNLSVIHEVLYRYFPISGCTTEVASQAIKRSAYFKGQDRGGRSTQFSLFNGSKYSRGASILLVLKDNGDWDPPFVLWYPPYP